METQITRTLGIVFPLEGHRRGEFWVSYSSAVSKPRRNESEKKSGCQLRASRASPSPYRWNTGYILILLTVDAGDFVGASEG